MAKQNIKQNTELPKVEYNNFNQGIEYNSHAKETSNRRVQMIKNMEIDSDGKLSVRRPMIPYATNLAEPLSAKRVWLEDADEKFISVLYAPFQKLVTPFIWVIGNKHTGINSLKYIDNENEVLTIPDGTNLMSRISGDAYAELSHVFIAQDNTLYIKTTDEIISITSTIAKSLNETNDVVLGLKEVETFNPSTNELAESGINLFSETPYIIKNKLGGNNVRVEGLLPYTAIEDTASTIFSEVTYKYAVQPKEDDTLVLKALLKVPEDRLSQEAKLLFKIDGTSIYDWSTSLGQNFDIKNTECYLYKTGATTPVQENGSSVRAWTFLSKHFPEFIWCKTSISDTTTSLPGSITDIKSYDDIESRGVMPLLVAMLGYNGDQQAIEEISDMYPYLDLGALEPFLKIAAPFDLNKYLISTGAQTVVYPTSEDGTTTNWPSYSDYYRYDILPLQPGVSDQYAYKLFVVDTRNSLSTVQSTIKATTTITKSGTDATAERGVYIGDPALDKWGTWENNYVDSSRLYKYSDSAFLEALSPDSTKLVALSNWQRPGTKEGFHRLVMNFDNNADEGAAKKIKGIKIGTLATVGQKISSEPTVIYDFHVTDGSTTGGASGWKNGDSIKIIGGSY